MEWQKHSELSATLTIITVLAIIGTGVGAEVAVAQEDKNIIARTAPGEDVTVQVGETVSLGYPAEDAPPGATYTWDVENGDTADLFLHTGSVDASGDVPGHDGRVTSFRATQEDNYTVSLDVRDESGNVVETISRDINVVSSDGDVSYDEIREYAPVLRFEKDELYRPTRIEAIFENAELRKGKVNPIDTDDEFEVFSDANLYDLSVRERPENQPDTGRDDTFEFILPNSVTDIWEGVFGITRPDAGTDGAPDRDALVDSDPTGTDVYPETVYAQTIEDAEFDPQLRGDEDRDNYYTEYDTSDTDLSEGSYVAIGYWMMYVNDPKPEYTRGISLESKIPFATVASHTGDSSVIYILFKKEGDSLTPKWMLNQQHKGGEYRKWEHVEKRGNQPVIYVAEGAHTSYFGVGQSSRDADVTVREPEDGGESSLTGKESPIYIYQDQYFQTDSPGTTNIFEFGITQVSGYVDIITYNNRGAEWVSGEDYEVSVLTGEEAWSTYTGDYLTYPIGDRGNNQGATAGEIPQRSLQFGDTRSWTQSRLFPDVAQIDGIFSDSSEEFDLPAFGSVEDDENIQDDIITPDGRDLECADYIDVPCDDVEGPPAVVTENDRVTPDEADGSVGVNVINTGMQPHEFTLGLDATGAGDFS